VTKREAVQDLSFLKLAKAGGKHVGSQSELALKIAVALRPLEQLFHDEESPSCSNDAQGRGEVTHSFESTSGFIQNGE